MLSINTRVGFTWNRCQNLFTCQILLLYDLQSLIYTEVCKHILKVNVNSIEIDFVFTQNHLLSIPFLVFNSKFYFFWICDIYIVLKSRIVFLIIYSSHTCCNKKEFEIAKWDNQCNREFKGGRIPSH